jgi:hypothetical protein
MIDELTKVADAMDKAGITPRNWHSKLHVLPNVTNKSPCIRIWLTADGHIKDIGLISPELARKLWKYEPANGDSLPGFNVRSLYRVVKPENEIKKTTKEIENTMGEGFDWVPFTRPEDDFWAKTRDGLKRCFDGVRENLERICADKLLDGEILQKFFAAVRQIDIDQFQKEYEGAVRNEIECGRLPISCMCHFVSASKKIKEDSNPREPVPKFSIFLDIEDHVEYPVAHEKTMVRLNDLLSDDTIADVASSAERDAYNRDTREKDELFPQVNLPVLGGVKLRSQVDIIHAQRRYNLSESATFPVGMESRKRVKAALEWIGDRERDKITNGQAGKGELLFAYPCALPQEKIPLSKMMTGGQKDSYRKEDTFKRLSESVIRQLKGLDIPANNAELEIFSLRKMDKARTKVVYYRNTTVDSLETASKAWHQGCQNIPPLDIKGWGEKNEKNKPHPIPVEPETVFPVQLHRYLNTIWKKEGENASQVDNGKVKGFMPTDGLDLLLETSPETLAAHMLGRFMQHAQAYFSTLCHNTGRRRVAQIPDKEIYPGILGLLLFKLEKHKEVFMKESAFLLGRFLRVTDEVHRLYCEVVRKKKDGTPDLPPELCGGAFMTSMLEAPTTALGQLCTRSAPYVKWARGGADKGDKAGLVGYWMKQWAEISDQLHVLNWPQRLQPEERAQVFLGYLSSFQKKEQGNVSETTDTTKEGVLQ